MGSLRLLGASHWMIDFARSLFEVAVRGANEQIKSRILFQEHGAKLRKRLETTKDKTDFLHKNMSNKCQTRQFTSLKSKRQLFVVQQVVVKAEEMAALRNR